MAPSWAAGVAPDEKMRQTAPKKRVGLTIKDGQEVQWKFWLKPGGRLAYDEARTKMLMRFIRKLAVPLILCLLPAASPFARGQDKEESKDHPLISRYPGSVIKDYNQKEYDEFELPMGVANQDGEKVGEPGKTQHLEGKVTFIRYDDPKGRSVLEVYRNFEGALRTAGFAILYTCTSVQQCGWGNRSSSPGRSEEWIDNGAVRHLSARLPRPQGDVYVSLIVQQHIVAETPETLLDVIEVKPMETGLVTVNAESLGGDLSRSGHAAVYGIYFETGKADVKPESDATLKEIAKLLEQNPQLKIYVVGHTDNQGTLDLNIELSKRRADAVLGALAAKYGVAADRLRALGDGPSAPVASNDTEDGRARNRRVELVKQ